MALCVACSPRHVVVIQQNGYDCIDITFVSKHFRHKGLHGVFKNAILISRNVTGGFRGQGAWLSVMQRRSSGIMWVIFELSVVSKLVCWGSWMQCPT
jgi:hypothetical protein